jgi:hypothetical protein
MRIGNYKKEYSNYIKRGIKHINNSEKLKRSTSF